MHVCIVGSKTDNEIWGEHLKKTETLMEYATSMHSLATSVWEQRTSDPSDVDLNDRIKWTAKSCCEYFREGELVKMLQKDLRRLQFGNPSQVEESLLPPDEQGAPTYVENMFNKSPWALLDVGSCYNPFSHYSSLFNTTAVDIAPATKVSCIPKEHS